MKEEEKNTLKHQLIKGIVSEDTTRTKKSASIGALNYLLSWTRISCSYSPSRVDAGVKCQ